MHELTALIFLFCPTCVNSKSQLRIPQTEREMSHREVERIAVDSQYMVRDTQHGEASDFQGAAIVAKGGRNGGTSVVAYQQSDGHWPVPVWFLWTLLDVTKKRQSDERGQQRGNEAIQAMKSQRNAVQAQQAATRRLESVKHTENNYCFSRAWRTALWCSEAGARPALEETCLLAILAARSPMPKAPAACRAHGVRQRRPTRIKGRAGKRQPRRTRQRAAWRITTCYR